MTELDSIYRAYTGKRAELEGKRKELKDGESELASLLDAKKVREEQGEDSTVVKAREQLQRSLGTVIQAEFELLSKAADALAAGNYEDVVANLRQDLPEEGPQFVLGTPKVTYILTKERLYAVGREKGELLWEREIKGGFNYTHTKYSFTKMITLEGDILSIRNDDNVPARWKQFNAKDGTEMGGGK